MRNVGTYLSLCPVTSLIVNTFASVAEVKTSIENALSDPTLYAHMTKTHDTNVYLIYEHADTSGRKKRKRPPNVDPQYEPPAVNAFQQTLDDIKLKSWPYVSSSDSI